MAVEYTFVAPETAPLDPGSNRAHKPRVLMPEFGDGYSQRAEDGINSDPATRQFSWTNLTEEEAAAIENFFKARRGTQSFFYDHQAKGKPKVYICTEWDVTDVEYDVVTIKATFQQVYDL